MPEDAATSPFLLLPPTSWVASNSLAFAIRDRHPISPGHTLVITKRPVPTWFDATPDEQLAILRLIHDVRRDLDATHHPDGWNIGINVAAAGGQTVPHLHVHVIPRYRGDVPDPRGGVRHVIPARANYLRDRPLATGGHTDPFLRHLRPLFARATDVAIIAAFVQDSGLDALHDSVFAALARGARIRLVTGDYLDITQAAALRHLLDWANASAAREDGDQRGGLEARVVEVAQADVISFHPKSWRFEGDGFGAAFVGSSNVSATALRAGIEWNLRVDREMDPAAYREVVDAFDGWWRRAVTLTADWVERYAERARREPPAPRPGEVEREPSPAPPEPNALQREALAALDATRRAGRRRALVVMATGLGKTWLAAFDVAATAEGRMPRVLFLAHRFELLEQAARTFRRMFPDARIGWFSGDRDDAAGDIVFASVQKLARPEQLARFIAAWGASPDYMIVDEVHHATAPSYRRILAELEPGFLLGLTATPDRADEADVLDLFDDNLPYRADLGIAIGEGLLVPFAYFGLRDIVDYANIPWRNRRFEPEALAAAVQTQARMERLRGAWNEHPAARSLVFCASIPHARFVERCLREWGVRAVAVHSEADSADRDEALKRLERGDLDAVCSVDLFNEGIDIPAIDRVVMLRPTESPVVFLQQLGRGLRRPAGKERLVVIDFVGNHRIFLDRLRLLLTLGPSPVTLREFLVDGRVPELPEGCSVDVELEAIDMLRRFLPSGATEVERAYRELKAARETRPTAGELERMGYRVATLRAVHGSWFDFVAGEGDLDEAERRVLEAARPWLREVETTSMTKSFKMVVLEVLLEREALGAGLRLDELARRSHAYLMRFPELMRDIEGVRELPEPRTPDPATWLAYWRKNPIAAWAGDEGEGRRWFAVEGERFVPRLPACTGDEATLAAMTRELVDWRLARYVRSARAGDEGNGFECVVLSNRRDPILKLPSRAQRPDLPSGETDVRTPDGAVWRFRFMKEFCNVARPVAAGRNELPDLLRRWFGPSVGRPGTGFRVRFSRSPDGWWVEPAGSRVVETAPRGRVVMFPSLRAAAGSPVAQAETVADAPPAEWVTLPVERAAPGRFAVRAVGDSMDGGPEPIRDGDWLVMRWARGASLESLEGRVILIELRDAAGEAAHQVKRLVREGRSWMLRSDNPAAPSFEASADCVPVAVLEGKVTPEGIAPAVGERIVEDRLAAAFGLTTPPRDGRVEGHLFALVTDRGTFVEPDRLRLAVPDRRPGETAFVLTRAPGEEAWRYAGVARWSEEEALWTCPPLDFATWRALGQGRSASRRLPPGMLDEAASVVKQVLRDVGEGAWIERDGKRLRVAGAAENGGLRIDGGPGGFRERTLSLVEVAWVLVARRDVERNGGVLDEARVNRLRYLEGTPKGATRWIDTGWAVVVSEAALRHPGLIRA